jgi:hypothetical protein
MRTFHFFGVRSRSAARWSWQRSLEQLANAHRQGRTTKEYLRADRLALAAHHASARDIDPGPGAPPSHFEPVPVSWRTRNVSVKVGLNRSGRSEVFVRIHHSARRHFGHRLRSLTEGPDLEVRRSERRLPVESILIASVVSGEREAISAQVLFGGFFLTSALANRPRES